MAARPYDRERDDLEPLEEIVELVDLGDYTAEVATQCGKLGAALKALLLNPYNTSARAIAQEVADEFDAWWLGTRQKLSTGTAGSERGRVF